MPRKKARQAEKPAAEEAGRAVEEEDLDDRGAKGRGPEFPVVGVGASAGGLEALRGFFGGIPKDSGMAFIIVQHLDPKQPSHLAEILARDAPGPAVEAEDGVEIEPNTFYVIPPNTYLGVEDGRLRFDEPVPEHGIRMPVDFLFRSLANEFGEKAICVVLSGTGSDGTLGLRQVRGAGGMAMAQDPDTTSYDSMPQNAIATGLVDYVLPPADMGPALLTYVRQTGLQRPAEVPAAGKRPEDLVAVLNLLLVRAGRDFRGYKRGTIGRRVVRRMGISQIDDLDTYLRRLRRDDEELQKLAKDMLIGVTGFFRDPQAFADLQTMAIAPLVESKRSREVIRAWVPASATGEEAYSVAILIYEELRRKEKACPVQIFASDLDEGALAVARHGVYPGSIEADVSQERLERYFGKQDGTYRVKDPIRDAIVFTTQDVISSPPFSRLDLVSCRNLLIYLEREIQEKVMALFGFALNPGGYLFLGKSDSISSSQDLFEVVSKKSKVYRRTAAPQPVGDFPILPWERGTRERELPRAEATTPMSGALVNQQVLLSHFEAALVVIDSSGRIRHFFGPTQRYLAHPTGDANLDLYSMVGRALGRRLRAAVRRALDGNTVERIDHVATLPNGNGPRVADITVRPVQSEGGADTIAAVIFERPRKTTEPAPESPVREERGTEAAAPAAELEAELQRARQELQATSEEYETTNEELRAAHEEAMSMNEELQSANEELESSKEELQSVNEELTTVNAQLRDKIEELNKTNSDLANLLSATHIATVFLDREFRVRRFTPAAGELLNLMGSDIGRPIHHLAQSFRDLDLTETARRVLRRLSSVQREVQTSDDRSYQMRMLPYRTVEDRIDGVVVTFSDVTELKQAERARAAIAGRLAAETSHRTKNNLAIVAGLLQLQANETQEPEVATKLREAVTRIRAVASLQDQMYQQNSDEVELVEALRQIATINKQVLAANRAEITVSGEPMRVTGPVATDLSVMANELLTNALKHGTSPEEKTEVRIEVERKEGRASLRVWNTGKPVREGFDIAKSGGLGLKLVQGIATEQYNGTFSLEPRDGGTLATVEMDARAIDRDVEAAG